MQDNLGHYTAAFSLDVYGRVSEKMKEDSAACMEGHRKSARGKSKGKHVCEDSKKP